MMFCGDNEVLLLSPACAIALFNVGPRSFGNMITVDIKAILYTIISKRNSVDELALACNVVDEGSGKAAVRERTGKQNLDSHQRQTKRFTTTMDRRR